MFQATAEQQEFTLQNPNQLMCIIKKHNETIEKVMHLIVTFEWYFLTVFYIISCGITSLIYDVVTLVHSNYEDGTIKVYEVLWEIWRLCFFTTEGIYIIHAWMNLSTEVSMYFSNRIKVCPQHCAARK